MSSPIKAAHIVELRARLDEARAALGLTVASYTDPTLTVGITTVKAVHIQELRQRVTEALAANSTNTSYDTATNRITTAGITYDAAGQILTDALFRGLKYQYNPEGRMIWSANLDNSNPSTSVYDGTGQRVQTTQAGVTKRYFYDINGSVVAEYEATGGTGYGALKRLNVCAGGRLLAVDEVQTDGSKVTSYLMADRQGSTRVLMNAAGAVTSRHDYLPFGEELGAGTGAQGSPTGMRTAAQGYSAADNVRQRYADTRLDDATGLDHTLWRKLETRSGRWTTPDPSGGSVNVSNPQSFNRYTYVHNDPVKFVDPSGLNLAYPGIGGGGYCWFISALIDDSWQLVGGYCTGIGGGGSGGDDTSGGEVDPPKPDFDVPGITKAVSDMLATADCANFAKTILDAVSSRNNPVYPAGGSLADVFAAFLNQKAHTLFTRTVPPGSEGYGNPIGNIKNGTASIYSSPATGNQTLFDADAVISELFHLAGQNNWYGDKELALALSKSSYAGLAASFISPERNIFDPSYVPRAGETEANQVAYSNYFHTIQSNVCHVLPGKHELK